MPGARATIGGKDTRGGRQHQEKLASRLCQVTAQPSIPLRTRPREDATKGINPVKSGSRPSAGMDGTVGEKGRMGPQTSMGNPEGEKASKVNYDKPPNKPFDPGGTVPVDSDSTWEWDPTPPDLKVPLPRLGDVLPDAPILLHPDLEASLRDKARVRWFRDFSMVAQAGRTKRVGKQTKYQQIPFGVQGRGRGEASLIIPAAQCVEATMKSLLKLRKQAPSTSALLLLPEDYITSDAVKTFLHAYCQRGEVYDRD